MELLIKIAFGIYIYCTDFTINLANLLSISYVDVNAIIFCVLWPAITILLISIYVTQKIRLRRLN
jgi:hypothetical protein